MKRLCGRNYDEPDVQTELARYPFRTVRAPHGGVAITINYAGAEVNILAEHFLSMVLVYMHEVACTVNDQGISEVVLAVPSHYTDLQRRSYLRACEAARLNCVKLVNEPAAVALEYGYYKAAKGLFHESKPING